MKFYATLNFLLTQDHMGVEISKRYSYSLYPMSAKLYYKHVSHKGMESYKCFGDLPENKNIMAL